MPEFLLGATIGVCFTLAMVYIGLKISIRRTEKQIDNLVKEIKSISSQIIRARVERHQDLFYVYNTQDETFMAQGSNLTELRQKIESRWRDAQVFVTEGDPETLQALKATATEGDVTHA